MGESSIFMMPSRLAAEGEQLVVHRFQNGLLGLAAIKDVRRHEEEISKRGFLQRFKCCFRDVRASSDRIPPICVPSGAYLILKAIAGSIQQRYGLEGEEGAVFLETNVAVNGYGEDELRFNNGAQVRVQELQAGQLVEVLSLAGTQPALYEQELQML